MACTSSAPESGPAVEPIDAPPMTAACAERVTHYLAQREQLSRCETDSDCAEMGPGLCPYGPYYIHREADIQAVVTLERELEDNCELPECAPPPELGIAHCEQGTCAPGRKPERFVRTRSIRYMSCWDYRVTWLEPNGATTATASSTIVGTTPHVAIAPASAGTLTLEVDWPPSCAECQLWISEHNSGMAQLITPKATRTATQRERLEFPVTPGPYHFVGMAETDTPFTIRADLRDAEGGLGRVTRHGVNWQHACEG